MGASMLAEKEAVAGRQRDLQAPSRGARPASLPSNAHPVLQLQRAAGNAAVTALLQRCGAGGCSCGGACRHRAKPALEEAEVLQFGAHRVQRHALARRTWPLLQRAQVINDTRRLEAELWKDNDRLQASFHNNPTLTGRDTPGDVALLQEALDTVFRAMPKSKKNEGGVVTFDGKWGNETLTTVRDYQVAHDIKPPGGFEAGRRTLDALDAELKARKAAPKPTPPKPAPKPTPPPTPAAKVCGPNVGTEMARAWASAQTQFRALSFGKKLDNCRMLVQPLIKDPDSGQLHLNADAFDTWGLFQGSVGWTRIAPWHGSCGTPGSKGDEKCMFDAAHEAPDVCSNTVQVGGDCWLSGTPNYGLFGIAMRECFEWTGLVRDVPGMSALHDLFSLPSAMLLAGGYKAVKGDNIVGPEKWVTATWLGGPTATATGGNRSSCSTTCAGPPPPAFAIVWEPNMPRSAAPGGPPYFPADIKPGC